ncbi:fungal-specific transcription factor domain-containing protein [Mycena crocata]|nr:fungal-specific transcription factor domain-containing protein [Mycena crocata]
MSTMYDEELYRQPKKRRLQRACDICRKRKIRCDSVDTLDGRCSSCISFNAECTHSEPARKRGPRNRDAELQELKHQVSALAAKLRHVPPPPDGHEQYSSPPTPPSDKSTPESSSNSHGAMQNNANEDVLHNNNADDDDDVTEALAERFNAFSLDFVKNRFFGASSGYMLVKNAIAAKEEYLGRPSEPEWKRPEYWVMRPWEKRSIEPPPQYTFPDADLIADLILLYFDNIHPTMPLLHRPSFERNVKEELHLRDHKFGALLLAVLALASRHSDDPRVFVPGADSTLSSGWLFFDQVQVVRKSLHDVPTLFEVQLYCLASLFGHGTSSPQASWLYLGIGIRCIQERGEHRRKRATGTDGNGKKSTPTVEGELWNRAFWCLLSLDTTICSFLGRPSAIHVEDYDVDPPLEVDDEYWQWEESQPAQAEASERAEGTQASARPEGTQASTQPPDWQPWTQPEGKPSLLSYFVQHIRLCEILGAALRRLYASNKSKRLMGWVGREWEQRAVADLDSAMNEWVGKVPGFLRWDPDRTGVFFDQSAVLYTTYYQLQITIHRPYIHTPMTLPFPSLAICTRAARSSINVVDVWLKKLNRVPASPMQTAPFISSVVLLLNVFGAKRAGQAIDVEKEFAHVAIAMEALKFFETRYQTSGRAWELVYALRSRDGYRTPVPKDGPQPQDQGRSDAGVHSVFTGQGTSADDDSNNTSLETAGGMSARATDGPSRHTTDGLSAHPTDTQRPPGVDLWNEMFMANMAAPAPHVQGPPDNMSLEQILAATAAYDGDGAGMSMDTSGPWLGNLGQAGSDGTAAFPSDEFQNDVNGTGYATTNVMPMDDEVMSMWMAAPMNFRDLDEWDSYLVTGTGTENTQPFNWSTDFDAQGQGANFGGL